MTYAVWRLDFSYYRLVGDSAGFPVFDDSDAVGKEIAAIWV